MSYPYDPRQPGNSYGSPPQNSGYDDRRISPLPGSLPGSPPSAQVGGVPRQTSRSVSSTRATTTGQAPQPGYPYGQSWEADLRSVPAHPYTGHGQLSTTSVQDPTYRAPVARSVGHDFPPDFPPPQLSPHNQTRNPVRQPSVPHSPPHPVDPSYSLGQQQHRSPQRSQPPSDYHQHQQRSPVSGYQQQDTLVPGYQAQQSLVPGYQLPQQQPPAVSEYHHQPSVLGYGQQQPQHSGYQPQLSAPQYQREPQRPSPGYQTTSIPPPDNVAVSFGSGEPHGSRARGTSGSRDSRPTCRIQNCNRLVTVDVKTRELSEYCGVEHMNEDLLRGAPRCPACQKCPRRLNSNYCGLACETYATQQQKQQQQQQQYQKQYQHTTATVRPQAIVPPGSAAWGSVASESLPISNPGTNFQAVSHSPPSAPVGGLVRCPQCNTTYPARGRSAGYGSIPPCPSCNYNPAR